MPKVFDEQPPVPPVKPAGTRGPYGLEIANQFRPTNPNKNVRKQVKYREEDDPNAYSGIMDSYRDNYLGAIGGFIERELVGGRGPDGWDPLDHVPEGYESFADAFAFVSNPQQLEVVKRQIDDNLANRGRREKRGFGSTFWSDLGAGIVDPSNLIAGPAIKGLGFLRGAATGAYVGGIMGVSQEATVVALDPSMQPGEGRARILGGLIGGTALGATFGGIGGAITRGTVPAGSAGVAANAPNKTAIRKAKVTQNTIIDHTMMVLETGKLVNNKEGAGPTKWGFTTRSFPNEDIAGMTYDRGMELAKKHFWLPEFNSVDSSLAAVAFDAYFISGSKKLVKAILNTNDAGSGLRVYRGFLNNLADTSSKHRKFKKGWNNRLNKLNSFLGGEPQRGRYAFDTPAGPRRVPFNERGYIPVKEGRTNIYDSNGRYVPAGYVKSERHVEDGNTLIPVPERSDRYETVADQTATHQPENAPQTQKQYPDIGDDLAAIVNRPAVRQADPEMPNPPRPINSPRDAAIELDRLERGDAELARQLAGERNTIEDLSAGLGSMGKGIGESFRAHLYQRYLKGATKEADSFKNESPLLTAAKDIKFKDFEEFSQWATDFNSRESSDNLPFALEKAAKKLPDNDVAFLTDVLEAKGLANLSQPELNQLYKLVSKLSKSHPEAAKLFMGKDYKGGVVTSNQAKARIDPIVLRRQQLAEQAEGIYERDVAPFQRDVDRDNFDRAEDETLHEIGTVDDEIETMVLGRDEFIKNELESSGAEEPSLVAAMVRSWKQEYAHKLALKRELRMKLRERLRDIRGERRRVLGKGLDDGLPAELSGEMLEQLTVADRKRIAANTERGRKAGGTFADREDVGHLDNEPPADLKAIWAHDKLLQRIAEYTNGQLRVTIQDVQDQLVKLEKDATRYIGRGETEVQYNKKQQKLFDRLTREMHGLQNRLWEMEAMDNQVDNLLPFTLPGHPNSKARVETAAEPYIAIDTDAILDSFKSKPWTQAVHGLPGMDEDAFTTPEQWLNFVYFHEREHVLNKRLDNETLGEYESRINARAYDASKGHDAPWKPVDGWAAETVLRVTPIGQLMQLVRNPANYVWESISRLAADYDLRLQRNLVPGGASVAGGSVFQKVMRHQSRAADYYNALENAYLKYSRGRASNSGATIRAAQTWVHSRKATKLNKLSFEEFDRRVGKAQATGVADELAEVNEAANIFNEIVRDMRRQEEELGLLPGKEAYERKLAILKGNIETMEQQFGKTDHTKATLARWADEVKELETRLANDVTVPGRKGLPYFTRLWNVRAMKDNPGPLIDKFYTMFIKDGHDPRTARDDAKKLYDSLVEDPASQSIQVASMPGELRSRELNIENDEVIDYIHQDSSIILNRYMKKNGAALEMMRAFGDPSGDMEQDRVLAALEAEGLKEDEIFAAMQIWQDARDRILGAFHGENPMSLSNRTVRFAKRWTRFAVMGLTGISQITDAVRAAWVVGPTSFAKGMFAPLFTQFDGYDPGIYAHFVGESMDIEIGLMSRRMMDDDDWTLRATESGLERLMGDVEVPFFILNGVTPLTKMFKRAVARATPHITIDRAKKVAAAVRAGKAVPEEEATWLREHGVDEHDAMLLADLPVHTSSSGWMTVDFNKWGELGGKGDRGIDLLKGVISGNIRRGVSTPGPLNRPRIMDGILIDKSARKKAWGDRYAAEQAEEDARQTVINMREAGFDKGNPQFDVALENLRKAAGVHKVARLNTGVKGRLERPLYSLPLQLQSFAFSQTSKLLHSMLSGRDKNVMIGALSLWGSSMIAGYLKGEITGANEHATWDEHLMRGVTGSGLLSWMSIPLEAAKGISRVAIGEVRMGDSTLIEKDKEGIADNIGVFGPTLGTAIGFTEGAFGKGFDGQDLSPSDRVYNLRKALPFGTLIYFNWLTRKAAEKISGAIEGDPQPQPPIVSNQDSYSPFMEGMLGFNYGDTDQREGVPEVAALKSPTFEELGVMSTDQIMDHYKVRQKAKMRKKGRRKRSSVHPDAISPVSEPAELLDDPTAQEY
jgi:hypothetical protein